MRLLPLLLVLVVLAHGVNAAQPAGASSHKRAMWVWEGWQVVSSPEKTQALLDFCAKPPADAPKVSDLYVHFPTANLGREEGRLLIAAFLSQAHAKGIRVHLLAGSVELSYQTTGGLKIIDQLAAYNAQAQEGSKFDGLHWDIEPHTMGPVWTKDNRLRDRFMETMKKYFERFQQVRGGMVMGLDVPVGYADDPDLLNALIDSTDYLALMDYRDTAGQVIAGAEPTLEAARAKGKKVVVGIELQRPNKKYGVTSRITFWDEGSSRMESALKTVEEELRSNPAFAGIAIHHYQPYTQISPEPQRVVDTRKYPELPALTLKRAEKPVPIDGDPSKWKDPPTVEIKEAREVVYGKPTWKSPQDFSAKAWLAWDDQFLYVALKVVDDQVVQPFEARKMVNGDHIELWLELSGADSAPAELFQIGLSPGNFADQPAAIVDWMPGGALSKGKRRIVIPRKSSDSLVTNDVRSIQVETFSPPKVCSTRTSDGYFLETRIAWGLLGTCRPAAGTVIRVNIDPSDTDSVEKPFQETLMSTTPFREWGNPKTFRKADFAP